MYYNSRLGNYKFTCQHGKSKCESKTKLPYFFFFVCRKYCFLIFLLLKLLLRNAREDFVSVIDLSPFVKQVWTIKVRVIEKGDLRSWNKGTKSGTVFSFTVQDASGSVTLL